MKKAAVLALLATLAGGVSTAAESAERHGHRYAHHLQHGRTVYSVYRSPRFIPPPPAPEFHWFAFSPTNRVNTHMY
jgi:hypothetical protein